MRRALLRTSAFVRAARKVVKKDPQCAPELAEVLRKLSADAFDPKLKTHKLSGKLGQSWACSVGYDLRIVFSFVKHEGKEAILLETLGTHEEVY